MFKKKELKNPITVIRKPDEINKEYSDIVLKLGALSIELAEISRAFDRMDNRKKEISVAQEALTDKVAELSEEMNEAQKQLASKQASPQPGLESPEAQV